MKRFALLGFIIQIIFSIQLFAVQVTIELRDSQGQLMDIGIVAYYDGGWHDLGNTTGGQIVAELPAANLKFRMTYAHGVNEKYQNTAINPLVVFQTVRTEVHLMDSDSAPIDNGAVMYYAGGWHDFGVTQAGPFHWNCCHTTTNSG